MLAVSFNRTDARSRAPDAANGMCTPGGAAGDARRGRDRGPDAGLGARAAVPPARRRPHAAERHTLSRSARMLAGIVRRSAHMAGRGRPAGVVTIRCCGRRTLAVYYRSRPRAGLPWHGTYEFKLRRRGTFLESVGIAFFPTAARWSYGAAGQPRRPPLRIHDLLATTLARLAPGRLRQLPRLSAAVLRGRPVRRLQRCALAR